MSGVCRFAACLVFTLISGCRYHPPTPGPVPRDEPVDGSFDATWSAVIDYFAERNIPVRTLEKVSGYVVAEYQWSDDTGLLRSADCGSRGRTAYTPDIAKFNVRVKPDGKSSTIRVTTEYVRKGGVCHSTGVWERQIISRVVRQVAGIPR